MSDNKKRATHFFDQLSNQGDRAMIDTDVWSDLIGSWHSADRKRTRRVRSCGLYDAATRT